MYISDCPKVRVQNPEIQSPGSLNDLVTCRLPGHDLFLGQLQEIGPLYTTNIKMAEHCLSALNRMVPQDERVLLC